VPPGALAFLLPYRVRVHPLRRFRFFSAILQISLLHPHTPLYGLAAVRADGGCGQARGAYLRRAAVRSARTTTGCSRADTRDDALRCVLLRANTGLAL